jgi:tetratricopeptide (TPR) repeat protein
LGVTYDALNLHGEAAEAYQQTVRIQPKNVDAWYNLGVNYALLGERGKDKRCLPGPAQARPTQSRTLFQHLYAALDMPG